MVKRKKLGAVNVVTADVPLNADNAHAVGMSLAECLTDGQPKAVLEMHNVPLLDSAGLEVLLDTQEQFERRAGVLKLAAPNPLCQEILFATGVASRFEIYRDLKSAVGSFVQ